MTVHTLPSRNPHVDCHLFPCAKCQAKRKAEQAARDRHPAGRDLPASARPVSGVRVWSDGKTLTLDQSDLTDDDIRAYAEFATRWVVSSENGAPQDVLDADADNVREVGEKSYTRSEVLRLAATLQQMASGMEVES